MKDWRPYLTQLTDEKISSWSAAGWWPDRRLVDYLDDAARSAPNRTAVVDDFGELTYAELQVTVDNVAAGLARLGVEPGDVVTCQLPNRAEVLVLACACGRIGAVYNGIAPIFRERDMATMLRIGRPKVLVVPGEFRGFSHASMAQNLRRDVDSLQAVLVIGEHGAGDGLRSWSEFTATDWGVAPTPAIDPNTVTQLAFTSGTTGEPKGILHTHNTVLAATKAFIDVLGLTADDVFHMASTLGHQTGYLFGVQMSIMTGGTVALQGAWDPTAFVELIERHRITMTNGAIPFLSDLLRAPNFAEHDTTSLRLFGCFGAGLPRPLARLAADKLPNARVFGGWGMTETGLAVINPVDDTLDQICDTDGMPIAGTEIRILDEGLRDEVEPGVEGELVTRGPLRHLGFVQPELAETLFLDGDWYVTGDRGQCDETGRFTMSARSKDIIVRGGENIPVIEVENLLLEHPAVRTVAVVAVPDDRLGEKACACVVCEPGHSFDYQQMCAWLESRRLTPQYWPEMLQVFDEFPTTASGKTQKFRLREQVRAHFTGDSRTAAV